MFVFADFPRNRSDRHFGYFRWPSKMSNVDGEKNEFFIPEIIRFYLGVKDGVSGFWKNVHAIKHAVPGTYSGNTRV